MENLSGCYMPKGNIRSKIACSDRPPKEMQAAYEMLDNAPYKFKKLGGGFAAWVQDFTCRGYEGYLRRSVDRFCSEEIYLQKLTSIRNKARIDSKKLLKQEKSTNKKIRLACPSGDAKLLRSAMHYLDSIVHDKICPRRGLTVLH